MFSGGNKFSRGFVFGCLTFLVLTAFFIIPLNVSGQVSEIGSKAGELMTGTGLNKTDLIEVINRIIKIFLGLLGVIAIIFIIYGGIIWMTSGGDAKRIAKAKAIIANALIGLIIIFLSYAITVFILGKLEMAANPGSGGSGGGSGGGPGSLPSSIFGIKSIETSYANPGAYHQNVYLCSSVQSKFNHWVSATSVSDADSAGTLEIVKASGGLKVTGSWQVSGGTVVFKHPAIFEKDTNYQAIFPKSLSNTQNPPKFLTACLASGGCVEQGTNFVWNFTTGQESDSIAPYVISTYPTSDKGSSSYPDQNVSKNPVIDVSFSEAVDATTVGSGAPAIPIANNIIIQKITDKEGSVLQTLDNNNFEVDIKNKGFYLNLSGNNLLDSFSWYRVTLANITDLCNNSLDSPYVWEFKTNDQVGNNNGSSCLVNGQCLSNCCFGNVCSASNKCQGGQNGNSCVFNSSCISNCCSNGVCAASSQCGSGGGQNGSACAANNNCTSGCCKNSVCVSSNQCNGGGQNGNSCVFNSSCISNCCSNGVCAASSQCGSGGGQNGSACAANNNCTSGCCKNSVCVQTNFCVGIGIPSILSVNPLDGSSGNCRNVLISVTFDQLMDNVSFKDNLVLSQGGNLISGKISSYNQDSNNNQTVDQTVLMFSPTNILDAASAYQVIVKGGINGVKSKDGGTMANDYIWNFSTGATICKINKVNITVEPPGQVTAEDLFQCAGKDNCPDDQEISTSGNQHRYVAQAFDKDNEPLSAVYLWKEQKNTGQANLLSLSSNSVNNPLVTATNKNGNTVLQVQAQSQGFNGKPNVETGAVDVQIFTCENPWPSLTDFPYKDSDTNFSTFYCRDGKTLLSDFDSKVVIAGKGDVIKEFLFKETGEKDAIGIRVMKNPEKLDPLMWYQKYVPNPSNASSLTVNGYEAVKSGRTVYVNAANVVNNKVYANIYLISYNEGASTTTINIFDQLLNNWRFNTNVIDLAEKQKLVYDLIRWGDNNEIISLLEKYKSKNGYYPKIASGSYIKGITTSKWPSWQLTLGKELGKNLPVDPVNEFGDCPGFNPDTCWNEQTKKFAGKIPDDVPYGTNVYFYQSINNSNGYILSQKTQYGSNCSSHECEEDGNCYALGSCHPAQSLIYCEMGTWQAVWRNSCGNSIVSCGEECDSNQQNYCDIVLGNHNWYNEPKYQGCLPPGDPNQCKWNPQQTYTAADCGGWCGDEQLNSSEQCDIGNQNGVTCNPPYSSNCTYCTSNCTNYTLVGAYCGDGNTDSGYEQCDNGTNNGNICSPSYNTNCSYCDNSCKVVVLNGAYCGDGTVNGPEQCEGNSGNGTSLNNQYVCSACHWAGGWCGDNMVESGFGEQCENPGSGFNQNNQYGCVTCKWAGGWCGDGTVQPQYGEQCEGPGNGTSANNQYGCVSCHWQGGWIGDGVINGSEQCDNGGQNGQACVPTYGGSCTYCDTNGQIKTVQGGYCGDNDIQGSEGCDNGSQNGVVCNPQYNSSCTYCNSSCQPITLPGPKCGDNITQSQFGEQCDDGPNNGNACTPAVGNSCTYCNSSCKNQVSIYHWEVVSKDSGSTPLSEVSVYCSSGETLVGGGCARIGGAGSILASTAPTANNGWYCKWGGGGNGVAQAICSAKPVSYVIRNSGIGQAPTISCNAGETLISGGCIYENGFLGETSASYPNGNTWYCSWGGGTTGRARAVCVTSLFNLNVVDSGVSSQQPSSCLSGEVLISGGCEWVLGDSGQLSTTRYTAPGSNTWLCGWGGNASGVAKAVCGK